MKIKVPKHGRWSTLNTLTISRHSHQCLSSSALSWIFVVAVFLIAVAIPINAHAQIARFDHPVLTIVRFDHPVLTWEGTGVRPANGHTSAAVGYTPTGLIPLASSDDTTSNYTVDNSPVAIWKEVCNLKRPMPGGGFEIVYLTIAISETTDTGAQIILTSQGEQWQLGSILRASIEKSIKKGQTKAYQLPNVVITGKVVRQTPSSREVTCTLNPRASIVPYGKGGFGLIVNCPGDKMQYLYRLGNGMPNSGSISVWEPGVKGASKP